MDLDRQIPGSDPETDPTAADPEAHSSGRPEDGINDKAAGTCGTSWHGPNGDELH